MSAEPSARPSSGHTTVGAGDLLKWVGLLADGPVLWGSAVRGAGPGVYLVELGAPLAHAPLDHIALRAWIEQVPTLVLDGERPTAHDLAARLASFWLPDQTVLYVGYTSRSLATRLASTYRTPLGQRRPASAGHWLKALQGLEQCRVWWSSTDAPEEYADALLSAFAEHVDPDVAAHVHDPRVLLPFANLETVTGVAKAHGITAALADEVRPAAAPASPSRMVHAGGASPAPAHRAAPRPRTAAGPPAAPRPAPAGEGPRPSAPRSSSARAASPRPASPRPSSARRSAPAGTRSTGTRRSRASEAGAAARPAPRPVYLSAEGLEEVKRELEELVTVRRPENVARIKAARELGDLRENADYQIARTEQSFLEGRIQTLEEMVRNVSVIEPTASTGQIALGSTVVVESRHGVETYTIVGSAESDPRNGRVSYTSPLGNAMLGHRPGDEVTVTTPGGAIQYHIEEVR